MTTKAHLGENLKKARELIAEYENWTVGAQARRRDNAPCDYWSGEAVQFCGIGAANRVAYPATVGTEEKTEHQASAEGHLAYRMRGELQRTAEKLEGVAHVPAINDIKKVRTREVHQKIIDIYDATIERLEKELTNAT